MAITKTISTIGTASRDYVSHAAWYTAEVSGVNTSGTEVHKIGEMYSDSIFTNVGVNLNAAATVTGHVPTLQAAAGHWHGGVDGSGVVIKPNSGSTYAFQLGGSGGNTILVMGLEVDGSDPGYSGSSNGLIRILNQNTHRVFGCCFHDNPAGHGWWTNGGIQAWPVCCIFHSNSASGMSGTAGHNIFARNCGAWNNGLYGYDGPNVNTVKPWSSWGFANPSGDFRNVRDVVGDAGYNIAGDTSLPTTANKGNQNSVPIANMNFGDETSGDFTISAGSAAIGAGSTVHRLWAVPGIQFDIRGPHLARLEHDDITDVGPYQFTYTLAPMATVPTPTANATVTDPQTDGDLAGTIDNAGSFVSGDILTVHLDSDDSKVGVGDAVAGTWTATGLGNGVAQTLKLKAHRSEATSSAFSGTVTGTPTATQPVGVAPIIAVVSPPTIVGVVSEG